MDYRADTAVLDHEIIVDLSDLERPLFAMEDLSDLLSEEQERRLVDYVRALMEMSHDKISARYDAWREADRAHDVWVPPEATSFREKVVISDTRAVADTVLTYLMAALIGRNPMFQIQELDGRSRRAALGIERLIHQHNRRTAGEARIAQILLDSIRYGFAPTKLTWSSDLDTTLKVSIDPRRAFPDPRVAWGDWGDMEFFGMVDYISTSALLRSGKFPKLARYPALRRSRLSSGGTWSAHRNFRENASGLSVDPTASAPGSGSASGASSALFSTSPARIIDEMWFIVSGYQVNLPAIDQLWLVATIIDEEVVIRFQLSPNGMSFPLVIGGLYFDRHKTFSQSLYDLTMPLHDLATWLLRSRVDNVQASMSNLIFADPTRVAITDLIDRNPWGVVRTMAGAPPKDGVYLANVPDVTAGHWNDIAALADLKQRVTAASDAQQGMPSADGIRSATEIARMTQLGSQRLGVLARILSALTIRPMVHAEIANLQDFMSRKETIRIQPSDRAGMEIASDGFLEIDAQSLAGEFEYMVVDGTLPIEPVRSADTWLTMLTVLNQTGLVMEYDAGRILEEAIRAMGVYDLENYKISAERAARGPSPSQKLALLEKARGASVLPEEEIAAEAQKGNLISARQAAGLRAA